MSMATDYIQRRFGIPPRVRRIVPLVRPPGAGELLLIAGPSGSGKSTLLRRMLPHVPGCVRLDRLRLRREPTVDLVPGDDVAGRLRLLARVGLADVHAWLRTPAELSDGQRWRLRLAIALSQTQGRRTLVCDEFASTLDTLTALIVCRLLRRLIRPPGPAAAVVVTGREELLGALAPDRVVWCDFGQVREIEAAPCGAD